MNGARKGANIWWQLFNRYPGGRWAGWELFTKRFWKNPHLWKDSFGQYWYRWIVCRFWWHENVKFLDYQNGQKRQYCFDCQQWLDPAGARTSLSEGLHEKIRKYDEKARRLGMENMVSWADESDIEVKFTVGMVSSRGRERSLEGKFKRSEWVHDALRDYMEARERYNNSTDFDADPFPNPWQHPDGQAVIRWEAADPISIKYLLKMIWQRIKSLWMWRFWRTYSRIKRWFRNPIK